MAFKAGSVYAEAILDTAKWDKGLKGLADSAAKGGKLAAGAFVAAMGVSIAKANEFQKSMSNVSTVIDTSVISTQDLTKQLLGLDPALGKTTELTDAMYQAFSAGADTASEAMATTVASAKFAGAALTDTATAVDVLTTASNAYGKDVVSTTQASDIFFTTIKQGKITGEQLSSTIGKSIPLFASLNIPLEQLGAGMAAMTKQGVNAAESTTQLNAIVNSFLKPSGEMTAALEAQGYASGSALLEAEGLSGALAFLEESTGGSKDELSKLLPSVEAVRGALALTGTGGEEFASIMEEMGNVAGATDEAFAKQEKTFETFRNQMDKVMIVSGNIGKFFVDDLAGGATEAAGAMLTFLTSASGMELVGNIAGAAAGTFELLKSAITPIAEVLGESFKSILSAIATELEELGLTAGDGSGAFDILGFVVGGVTAVFRVASVSTTEFIGFLGDLVTAVTASGETVGNFFSFLTGKKTWDDVKASAGSAKDAFVNLGRGVGESFSKIAETVVGEVQGFTEQGQEYSRTFESSFTLAFDRTKENVIGNWDEMLTGQENFVGQMLENNQNMIDEMNQQNDEGAEETKQALGSILDYFKNQFSTEFSMNWGEMFDLALSTVGSFVDSWSAISSQSFANQNAELENWKNEELAELDERYSEGLITQEQYESERAALEEEALRKENEIKEKQFKTQKALNIANVWIDAAGAILGWWKAAAALGPIAGPIFAGVMTGATVGTATAQTALIAGQEFVPARRFGGMASGATRINEVGGEIVTLPDGSQVIPNDISRQIAGNAGGSEININFYDTRIGDQMDVYQVAEDVSRIIAQKMRTA